MGGKCSDNVLFLELCQLLNAIEALWRKKGPNRRQYILQVASQWFSKYTSGSLFTLFRLALPGLDHSRVFGIKERRLALLSVRALGLEKTHRGDALLHWRDDSRPMHLQGELSLLVELLLESEALGSKSTLTIMQVDEMLTDLAQTVYSASNFASVQVHASEIIRSLFLGVTPMEAKWICRIILKAWPDSVDFDPRLLFDAFHGWMWRMYRNVNELRACCTAIVGLIERGYHAPRELDEEEWLTLTKEFFNPVLGSPVAIMACGRATSVDYVLNKFDGKQCWIETKYDGERLQAHLNASWPNRVKIFSKGGKDSTARRFGCHKYLVDALGIGQRVHNAIVEGELLVYNETKGIIEPFGTVQLFANRERLRCSHLMVVLYDLLYLNGESLTHRPLYERRQLLCQNTTVIPTYVEISAITPLDLRNASLGKKILTEAFEECIRERQEGLLIKDITSAYVPNGRRHWLKLKKDYIEGFGDTAEFLIIGAAYGREDNKRNLLSELVVGCLVNKREVVEEEAKPLIQIVFTVSYGLNEPELLLIQHFLTGVKEADISGLGHNFLPCPVPVQVDYYLERPLMAELLGSGFTKERGHSFYTLRFPRIRKLFTPPNNERCYLLESVSFQELQEMAMHANTPTTEEIKVPTVLPLKREFKLAASNASVSVERHYSPSQAALSMCLTQLANSQEEVTKYYYVHDPLKLTKSEVDRIEGMFLPAMRPLYTMHAVEQVEESCYVVVNQESHLKLPNWCKVVNV